MTVRGLQNLKKKLASTDSPFIGWIFWIFGFLDNAIAPEIVPSARNHRFARHQGWEVAPKPIPNPKSSNTDDERRETALASSSVKREA
jgi:hypothetical protein